MYFPGLQQISLPVFRGGRVLSIYRIGNRFKLSKGELLSYFQKIQVSHEITGNRRTINNTMTTQTEVPNR